MIHKLLPSTRMKGLVENHHPSLKHLLLKEKQVLLWAAKILSINGPLLMVNLIFFSIKFYQKLDLILN